MTEKFTIEHLEIIDAKEADYLYIKTSNIIGAGMGLYTSIKLYTNEIIAIYNGKLLTLVEAKNKAENNLDSYFMNMPNGSILDAMNVKGFAKYANDAQANKNDTYKNNAIITQNSQGKICLAALYNIKAGEEIYCSYGVKYWKKYNDK
ncbi:MAG: SET domain-containing protein [Bacteroidota bacterium]|nr:SET domain-containing protein [Bacteroidota bacterium]